jgi:hypothetical protein
MPARSDGDGGAAARCEDGERRARRQPVVVDDKELVWARLRSRGRKLQAASVLSYLQAAAAFLVWRKEKRSTCKREGGNKWGWPVGLLSIWPKWSE